MGRMVERRAKGDDLAAKWLEVAVCGDGEQERKLLVVDELRNGVYELDVDRRWGLRITVEVKRDAR